jgi:hypothetical protein
LIDFDTSDKPVGLFFIQAQTSAITQPTPVQPARKLKNENGAALTAACR